MKASNKRLAQRVAMASALALVLVGCQQRLGGLAPLSFGGASGGDKATSAGGAIVVNQGDSLYVISRRYDVPLRDLIEINKLSPPYNIEPGQRLVLPTARQYIVQPGDTLYGVSRMFGVDVSELTRLNNLTPPYAIKSGQPLRLPSPAAGYAGGDGPTQLAAAPRSKIERSEQPVSPSPAPTAPAPVAPASTAPAPVANVPFNAAAPSVVYQPGQEPKGLRPGGSLPPPVAAVPPAAPAPVAAPTDAPTNITLKPGKKPVPVTETPAEPQSDPAPEPVKEPAKEQVKEPAKEKPRDVAAAPSAPPPGQAKPAPAPAATVAPPPPAAEAEPPPRAAGRFLMPVKGSIISGFGPKPGGQHNDGLNIAAAKGTAVIAADNGVVAYAGNELRGFGNLLLIRHADGWVTAYAHLDHIDVERGAEVKRGQKIGGVGQSGGVPTPQLHFEVRKGSQAVDPKGQM